MSWWSALLFLVWCLLSYSVWVPSPRSQVEYQHVPTWCHDIQRYYQEPRGDWTQNASHLMSPRTWTRRHFILWGVLSSAVSKGMVCWALQHCPIHSYSESICMYAWMYAWIYMVDCSVSLWAMYLCRFVSVLCSSRRWCPLNTRHTATAKPPP